MVDDDPGAVALLVRGLSYEGHAVDVAFTGEEGLRLAVQSRPDLVVLGVTLPGLGGLEVCQRLREADRRLPILMLTASDAASDQVRGLDTGADDCVVKPFVFEVLAARIMALLRRREAPVPEVLRYADLALDTASRQARRGGREVDLTTTEYELLQLFLRNPECVLTRSLIMDRVWGYDFDGNYNVLEVYVSYLRAKLEAGDEPRLIQTVRGAGYVLRAGE